MKKYPIAKPYITQDEIDEVLEVMNSGYLSLGPKYREFEKKFAEKIGTKYACAVSSGTAGLHLAMIAAGIKEGDEVITSPFSFIASANSILYVGAKPVFVDIDPKTLNMDPARIEEKITPKTKAILVVHIFGQTSDMSRIMEIATKHGLKVIEDACESICATHKNKNAGTFGESAVFAFYPNKQMTTGEGGMIVTDREDIYKLCSSLSNQGRAENMQWLDHTRLGYNYRMGEINAGLGLAQLRKLDYLLSERRKIAELYNKYLGEHEDILQVPHIDSDNCGTWFVYVVIIKNKDIDRDKIIMKLTREGVSTKPYLPSIHLFDFYKKQFGFKRGAYSVSERASDYSLALPFYLGLNKEDIKYIINKVINAIKKYDE